MLIDTHVHTSPVSLCSSVTAAEMVECFIRAGFGGVVLTNHYNPNQMSSYGDSFEECIREYVDEYYRAREFAAGRLKIFMGAEVALKLKDCPYAEFLLFGGSPEFFLSSGPLYLMTQKKLFETCCAAGVLVYQSHPFRKEHGHFPHNPLYMHGVEINCHPNFFKEETAVRRYAEKNNLLISCGSDFHYAAQAGTAGMEIDGSVSTDAQLAEYLLSGKGIARHR